MSSTLAELAAATGTELVGDGDVVIERVASLTNAGPGTITFLSDKKYRRHLGETRASAVILPADMADRCPVAALVAANPHVAFARVAAILHPARPPVPGIHPSAVVDPDAVVDASASIGPQSVVEAGARIGPRVVIGPGCVIGARASVGADSRLVARVTLCSDSVLGQRVLVHPGAVIGSDGFGLAKDGARWLKVPQVGRAVIGDDVEIGANTTIDRGAIDDTVVERGVKIDNLVQIGHNVQVGEDTIISACTGIAGSTRIGKQCMIGGGVGIGGHIEIADNVVLTGASVVPQSVKEAGWYSSTLTVQPQMTWNRNLARLSRLDELARRLGELEKAARGGGRSDE